MRLGLMIGSDKERPRGDRLAGLIADGRAAEDAGFASFWIPQVPGYLDAMTAIALLGQVTERIEIGSAVIPVQTRHPIAMAQQALTTQSACEGRFALGLGTSHHWIVGGQLGLPYERPAHLMRDYLEVITAAFAGPGHVDAENDTYRVHSPMDVAEPMPMPILIAALGPTMLRIAGEQTSGTILWMADERAIGDHVAPRITSAATRCRAPGTTHRRRRSGRLVLECRAGRCTGLRERSARARGVLTQLRALAGARRRRGCRRHHGRRRRAGRAHPPTQYRDAGVTDLAARIVPLGADPAARTASRMRTQEFIADIMAEF